MKRQVQLTGQRTFRLERAAAKGDGQVAIAISSEAEVNRGWYIEVLSHDPGAVVLARAALGLPFLVNHDTRDLVGRVEAIALDGRTLRGQVRFGASERSQEIATDIADGIRPDISVGYQILDFREEKRDGQLYIIATRWEPMEVSSVPVPADFAGAGVGRSADAGCANPDCTDPDCEDPACEGVCSPEEKCSACVSHRSTTPGAARSLPTHPALQVGIPEVRMEPTLAAPVAEPVKPTNVAELRSNAITETLEVLALAKRAGLETEAGDMLRNQATGGQIRQMLLDKIMARGGNPFGAAPATVDLSFAEQKKFSISRAIMAGAFGQPCFEREVSDSIAKTLGREAAGIYVPTNLQVQTRAQDATVAASAKNLISLEPVTFIELLRAQAMVLQCGATYLPGCVGNIPFARQITGGTAVWTGDNPAGATANTDPTTETFTMTPRQLMAVRSYSKQLLVQTAGFADRYVTEDLAKAHALEVDRAAMFGSGVGAEPKGVVNFAGIGAVAGGANGAAPTWGNLVDLETAVNVANALDGALCYITNAKGRGFLKKTLVAAAAGSDFIWAKDNTINGYKACSSNQVPSNLVKGASGAVCSAILYGNWSELLVAEWGALDLVTDPYTQADKGLVRIVSTQLVDINLRHVQSFAVMLDALMG